MSETEDTTPDVGPFAAFGLDDRLVSALTAQGFAEPTPIQAAAIPVLLSGRDVVGRARTGSGKTAAYGLPLLQRVKDGQPGVRALVLAPTRELAIQVTHALSACAAHLPIRVVTIYGGVPYGPQFHALRAGPQVVVGTPGRILDHMERGTLDLGAVEVCVLDEADEMLRMGFVEDVETILAALRRDHQTALFSATMPDRIQAIAKSHLRRPVEVQVEESALVVDHITQRWMRVPDAYKLEALLRLLAAEPHAGTLVFARTRLACAELSEALVAQGVSADALHGDLSQAARERVLGRLRARHLEVVVATDVAARGLDVTHLTHVVNLDLPEDLEGYVHRIGRTGRAGQAGLATSFVTPSEVRRIAMLERLLGVHLERFDVPTDAKIAEGRRARLRDELAAVDEAGAGGWLEALQADGWTPEQIARGALGVLIADRRWGGLPASDQLPAWARPREVPRVARPERPVRPTAAPEAWSADAPVPAHERPKIDDNTALFLAIGSARGVRPADVVAALIRDAGVPEAAIGRIGIFTHKTFVGMPEPVLQELLERRRTIGIRGQNVPIDRLRPRAVR